MLKKLIYNNLFDCHPPFQIDGNFGIVAGMAEMLLQSHNDRIVLLPAIYDKWRKGSFRGLKARGNYEVCAEWNDDQISNFTISKNGKTILHQTGSIPFGYSITMKELEELEYCRTAV